MLTELGVDLPVLAAPMAGGPGAVDLAIAAGAAGSLGFVAGGYKPPAVFESEIAAVAAAGVPFGANLFAPNPVRADAAEFRAYAALIAPEAARYGVTLADKPVEDDDGWHDKIDVLLARPVPVVSFTFGLPPPADLAALRAAGMLVVQGVTTADEARQAAGAGSDALAVQAAGAGGHSATFTAHAPVADVPLPDLVARIRAVTSLPIIAAGGVATAADVSAAVAAGAEAVAVGTLLLLSDEAGTSPVHRAALADAARKSTVLTRAFTGRPARGLRNSFTDAYSDQAPYGYPALHHLTSGMRRAAAAAGDPERVHLWAGTGHQNAVNGPAATILTGLAGQL